MAQITNTIDATSAECANIQQNQVKPPGSAGSGEEGSSTAKEGRISMSHGVWISPCIKREATEHRIQNTQNTTLRAAARCPGLQQLSV